jgi:hypothetical protein
MLLGWQRICKGFLRPKGKEKNIYESSDQKELQQCEIWEIHMGSREKEFIFHKGHQKEREILCRSLLRLRHLWSPLRMLLPAPDGTAIWCFFFDLIMSFSLHSFVFGFPKLHVEV